MMSDFVPWLRKLAHAGGKGVVDNIDARSLGRIADELERSKLNDTRIRNIIFNVEQNPGNHTVEEMLENMRRAIGVEPEEKV